MSQLPKQKNHEILVDISKSLKQLQIDVDELKTNISQMKNDLRVKTIQDLVEKPLPKEEEPVETGWFWRS